MRTLTVEQGEASHISFYREPSVADVQAELEDTPLGSAVMALCKLAREVDDRAAKREAAHVMGHRRYLFRLTDEERLAQSILNLLGADDDCYPIREIAERAA